MKKLFITLMMCFALIANAQEKIEFKLDSLGVALNCDTVAKYGTARVCFIGGEEKSSIESDSDLYRETFHYGGATILFFQNRKMKTSKTRIETNREFKIGKNIIVPEGKKILKGMKFKIVAKTERGYEIEIKK